VGKGEDMNSTESSYQQEVPMEVDQRSILIIGGIQIFLPNSPAEARTSIAHEDVVQQESKKEAMGPNDFKSNYVCDAGETKDRKPVVTVIKEEKEKTLMFSPATKEENSTKLLKSFIQEDEHEMTTSTEACGRRGSRQHGFC
jgi:hypothetical protein